jgi:pyruvate/2-oxoacid:ferredoxin oxidoreductase beta subunit
MKPVQDYLKLQGRFRHLSEDIIQVIQERVIEEYEKIKEKAQ